MFSIFSTLLFFLVLHYVISSQLEKRTHEKDASFYSSESALRSALALLASFYDFESIDYHRLDLANHANSSPISFQLTKTLEQMLSHGLVDLNSWHRCTEFTMEASLDFGNLPKLIRQVHSKLIVNNPKHVAYHQLSNNLLEGGITVENVINSDAIVVDFSNLQLEGISIPEAIHGVKLSGVIYIQENGICEYEFISENIGEAWSAYLKGDREQQAVLRPKIAVYIKDFNNMALQRNGNLLIANAANVLKLLFACATWGVQLHCVRETPTHSVFVLAQQVTMVQYLMDDEIINPLSLLIDFGENNADRPGVIFDMIVRVIHEFTKVHSMDFTIDAKKSDNQSSNSSSAIATTEEKLSISVPFNETSVDAFLSSNVKKASDYICVHVTADRILPLSVEKTVHVGSTCYHLSRVLCSPKFKCHNDFAFKIVTAEQFEPSLSKPVIIIYTRPEIRNADSD